MWNIDDDDVSLQSLISEMSDYESIACSFDENRSHVSRELGNNKNIAIDDWTNVYPYNQRARPTSISERGLRMLDENMQYNDPISRPGANTAYEGTRPDRKGLSVEQTFNMSQEHKIMEVRPSEERRTAGAKRQQKLYTASYITNNLRLVASFLLRFAHRRFRL